MSFVRRLSYGSLTPVIERPEGVRDDPILHSIYIARKLKKKKLKKENRGCKK